MWSSGHSTLFTIAREYKGGKPASALSHRRRIRGYHPTKAGRQFYRYPSSPLSEPVYPHQSCFIMKLAIVGALFTFLAFSSSAFAFAPALSLAFAAALTAASAASACALACARAA